MAAPTVITLIKDVLEDFGVDALKPEQEEIISAISSKKDCIAVLPTGYGKSLPFQVYAAAQKRMTKEVVHVLVCSPLLGLMKDQTKKLSHISVLNVGYKECSDYVQNIAFFHSESSERNTEEIISSLGNSSTTLKVVIATSALGMGIDIFGCNSIILYGPPNSTIDFVQAKGRVGRDGNQSVALLLYNSYNARYVDADMKNVIQTTKCRRQALMQSFLNASELEKK